VKPNILKNKRKPKGIFKYLVAQLTLVFLFKKRKHFKLKNHY